MPDSRLTIREWCAAKIGRMYRVTAAQDTGLVYNVPELADFAADNEQFIDSYLMLSTIPAGAVQPEWRRIGATNTSLTPSELTITRQFDDPPEASTDAVIYQLLSPDQWNEAINEALTPIMFVDRAVVTVEAEEREYELPTWIKNRGQVRRITYRNIETKHEAVIPRWRINTAHEVLTLVLLDEPWSETQYQIIVEAVRYHARLDEDQYGTTVPQALWQAAVVVAALHKVMNKYGMRFKQQYMQDLMIAERQLMHERARHNPPVDSVEITLDDDWEGPDIEGYFINSGWAN